MYSDRKHIKSYVYYSNEDAVNLMIKTTTAAHSAIQNISASEVVYVHTLVACFSLCTGSYDGVSC